MWISTRHSWKCILMIYISSARKTSQKRALALASDCNDTRASSSSMFGSGAVKYLPQSLGTAGRAGLKGGVSHSSLYGVPALARWGHPQHPGMPREWCHKYRRSQDRPQQARRLLAFMTLCHLERVSDEAVLLIPTLDWEILTSFWDWCLVLFVPLVHD